MWASLVSSFLGGFVVGFLFLWGKFDFNHILIQVVDRPCLALVRQCRRKKKKVMSFRLCRTAKLGISMESATFCQPFNNSSNVLNCMRVSTWDIPKNREEAPSHRFFMGDKLTKVPTCPIECGQQRRQCPCCDPLSRCFSIWLFSDFG